MAEFYIPAYNSREGFQVLKWNSIFREEKPIQCDNDGKIWNGWKIFQLGKDVFKTKQEAVEKAKELRVRKITNLEKQIAKLKSFS